MLKNRLVLSTFAIIITFAVVSNVLALNTARIDVVRSKQILNDDDTGRIEDFLSDAMMEFMAIEDFTRSAEIRSILISRSESELESGQIQYGPRFMTAAQKEIARTVAEINKLDPSQRKTMLEMNMAMIIAGLKNVEIAKSALTYLDNDSLMVRYWAVKALTNCIPDNQQYSASSIKKFTEQINAIVAKEKSDAVFVQMAQFAAKARTPEAANILVAIVNKRLVGYNRWEVTNEIIDSDILGSIAVRVKSDKSNSASLAKSFALLYSAVIQRYVLGQEVLSDENKENLISVITQAEKYLPRFVPDWQSTFKRAIEKNAITTMLAEHDNLFGTSNTVGKMPAAMGFDYGKAPGGSPKKSPPAMSKPPQK